MFDSAEIVPWALPVLLVGIAAFFKLAVGQPITLDSFARSLFEFPVDILFVAISLIIASAITDPNDLATEMISLLGSIIVALLVIIIWRGSNSRYAGEHFLAAYALVILNLAASTAALVWSILVLTKEIS